MGDYAVREIATGLGFLEAPVETADGNLLVVDVGGGWILHVDVESGDVEPYVQTGGGPNGLAYGPGGNLYVANTVGMRVARSETGHLTPAGRELENPGFAGILEVAPDRAIVELYAEHEGRPLLAPNDLVFDAHGGMYFTDIGRSYRRRTDLGSIYYALADGSELREIIHQPAPATPVTQPNGISLSPAEDMVYVAETVTGRVWGWQILEPGVIDPTPHLIHHLRDYGRFDSMAVDAAGFICVATLNQGGVTVIAPDGTLDRFIPMPEHDPYVTNLCFGGDDLRTAYVTGGGLGKIWAVDWPRPGLRLNYALR